MGSKFICTRQLALQSPADPLLRIARRVSNTPSRQVEFRAARRRGRTPFQTQREYFAGRRRTLLRAGGFRDNRRCRALQRSARGRTCGPTTGVFPNDSARLKPGHIADFTAHEVARPDRAVFLPGDGELPAKVAGKTLRLIKLQLG